MDIIIPDKPSNLRQYVANVLRQRGKDININERISFLNMIIESYRLEENYKKCIKYSIRVYKVIQELFAMGGESPATLAMIENNLAFFYHQAQDKENAKKYVEMAMRNLKAWMTLDDRTPIQQKQQLQEAIMNNCEKIMGLVIV
jgi:hypothetical protein